MPRIGHFEVTIEVNNELADEFDDNDDEPAGPDTVTKYIEAVSGAHFAVKCQVLPGYNFETDHLVFGISLDGNEIKRVYTLKSEYDPESGKCFVERHVSVDGKDGRKIFSFSFANLNSRESLPGECVEDMRAKLQKLGTISVEVWRKNTVSRYEGYYHAIPHCGTTESVPEKALKGRALSLATT